MSHPIAAGKSSFDLVDPERVLSELRLQPDTVLLDLACGIGNYALAAATVIGPAGTVYAFDLWPEGIDLLRQSARERGVPQVRAEVADVREPLPLPAGSCDLALMATVLHDLAAEGGGEKALREAARLLRPGGRLVVIEFEKVDSHPGPPAAIRLAHEEVEALVVPCGFRRERLVPVGDPLYLLSFVREG
ncbi:MAG: methyltransferase domain-containing protein [Desulfuromonadales bacterium]|nr:methyltransferase domain-containing protein [Desulfuromonadales bacterium]